MPRLYVPNLVKAAKAEGARGVTNHFDRSKSPRNDLLQGTQARPIAIPSLDFQTCSRHVHLMFVSPA